MTSPIIEETTVLKALQLQFPQARLRTRLIDRISYASDAGFYHLIPMAVVLPVSEQEVVSLFRISRENGVPLVFRTGGTSLSGQAITDGILVDLSRFWNKLTVTDNGKLVRVQPGITGAMVNAQLKNYRRKIGPDPSSISAAMMGGILSNNASGMCCGVVQNAYHTTRYIRFILPNGIAFSTEKREDYGRLQIECPELFQSLIEIRDEIRHNQYLRERIREKYRTKTTIGYSLNAFIDYSDPLDILAHLLIGAEGTLAFIAEAVLDTVPDYPCKSTALLYFPGIYEACQAIEPLTDAGALMVELMDRASLRAVEQLEGMPVIVKTLPPAAAALLVEFQEENGETLRQRVDAFLQKANALQLINAPEFTEDPKQQDFFWKVRKGLFPAVGAVRKSGTTVILEDLAFPVARLGDAILDLQTLFEKFGYHNAIIFGHAKDGNIHFVVTQGFNSDEEVGRYDRFIREVVEMVIKKYGGTLKAEHGTGRNMAPFVETEWGGDAYRIIARIKRVIDPEGMLNPGVIVNADTSAHIRNLKELPTVEEEVDRCIECGYCEHRCPSRDITATPRRRIVIRRALESLKHSGSTEAYRELLEQYPYEVLDTCAVDGLCATACPVDINTGDLVKRLRRENHSPFENRIALWVARNFGTVERLVRVGLRAGATVNTVFGKKSMYTLTRALHRWIPSMPIWGDQLPLPPDLSKLRASQKPDKPEIIYFPACISRVMGSYPNQGKNLLDTFLSVCTKSGIAVEVLQDLNGTCCSQIFSSKGFGEAHRYTAEKIIGRLWTASREGHVPVVIDVSSCAYTLHHLRPVLSASMQEKFDRLKILDSVDFLHDMVLPRVRVEPLAQRIVLHPVCSLEKMKTTRKLTAVARVFAREVTVPIHAGCCGMAGDRGFLFPELTASATAAEAAELCAKEYDGYYSSTKTCEMALSEAVGKNYNSILYLVDQALSD